MNFELIVFDMDGTICDSWPSMLYCYKETLKKYGNEDMPDEEFCSYFVGYLPDNLKMMLHTDDDALITEAVAYFRQKYEERGHALSGPFPPAVEAIKELHKRGYKIGLATMTLERYAIDTLKELGIDDCFDVAHGSTVKGDRTKSDMIEMCISETDSSRERTLMIGDGFNDLEAAKRSKVHFLAAAYGFGITKENCIEYGYRYAERPEDLIDAIERYR